MRQTMGAYERVRAAIEAPTAEAAKLLDELQHANQDEKLTILVNGWCRGLAGALEELALSIDTLERRNHEDDRPTPHAQDVRAATTRPEDSPLADEEPPAQADDETEATLVERARESRAQTAALRDEGKSGRQAVRDPDDE